MFLPIRQNSVELLNCKTVLKNGKNLQNWSTVFTIFSNYFIRHNPLHKKYKEISIHDKPN